MHRDRLLALAVLLIVCVLQPVALLCQDDSAPVVSAKESYNGEPLCHGRRGFPRPIYQLVAEYDDKDRKKKIEGYVGLSLILTKEGKTADIKVTKSLTQGLDQQAIKSVSQWTFEPVIVDGRPCPMKIAVQVTFKLY